MNLSDILTLLILMLALAATPSTSVALVVIRSATAGFKHGVAVTCGIVLGDLIFVLLAVAGMAALAEAMGSLFIILRYLAGAYLIWFGISLLRTGNASESLTEQGSGSSLPASFLSGLIITLGDIKAILFYASLFPAFIDVAMIGAAGLVTVIFITVVAVGGVKLGYACAARQIRHRLVRYKEAPHTKVIAGTIMAGAGTYMIIKI
ncbi:LysE family translocator [Lacimicrobium alkaliphilum]|uniref:Threonine transporter n=1 Tax=Lacimicrobium alkaliphilum TaxID=1526571 RepID=A0A0U3B5B6_9ALTE|nr:LysE family translocator [Lacimicrobium alkaliphilum]ALS96853.1 threonine transporter [Lacimicrobium alkaliphilum]